MTPEVAARVAGLEQRLGEQVAAVLSAARACPSGGDVGWDRLLSAHGVAPQSAEERLRTVAAARLPAGASPVEVRRVLDVVAARAEAELDAVAPGAGPQDLRVGALRYRLASLGDKETGDYVASLTARSAVGSVFANAKASAAAQPWKQVACRPTTAFTCVHCGAPQQVQLDFICHYCGKHVTEKGEPR